MQLLKTTTHSTNTTTTPTTTIPSHTNQANSRNPRCASFTPTPRAAYRGFVPGSTRAAPFKGERADLEGQLILLWPHFSHPQQGMYMIGRSAPDSSWPGVKVVVGQT